MIKTVVFDIDDTVYDCFHADSIAVNALASYTKEQFGWDKEEYHSRQKAAMADIRRYVGLSGAYRSRLLRYKVILEMADLPIWPHARRMQDIYFNTLLDNMVPEEGIADWMQYLRDRNIRIGIGTDAITQQQFMKLEKLGLLPFIDFMVTSEEAGIEKPDPQFFARCNEKIKCLPEEVMFIGDNPEKDYKGSDAAGYYAVLYNPLYKQYPVPMRELHRYKDAPALLEALNSERNAEDHEK